MLSIHKVIFKKKYCKNIDFVFNLHIRLENLNMSKKYCYDYPHPAVTTDIVVFTVKDRELHTLLIQRGIEPYKNCWAIPGGFVLENENIDLCALRELAEETGVKNIKLRQLAAYGMPKRDPRGHVITIAYYALIKADDISMKHGSDAADAKWFKIKELPELAFDHDIILNDAQKALSQGLYDLDNLTVFELLEDKFTIPELQIYFEALSQKTFDRRNFSKKIKDVFPLQDTGDLRKNGPHRPSKIFQLAI